MELAIVFLVCGLLSLVVAFMSANNRILISAFVIICLAAAYLTAGVSNISPFSISEALGFGYWDQSLELAIGVVGIILGVIVKINPGGIGIGIGLKQMVQPLLLAPMILIPSLKIIEGMNDPDLIAHAILFCTSFQNGFFWKSVTEKKKGGEAK